MQGLFLLKLRPFLAEKLLDEEEAWSLLFRRARVPYTVFVPQGEYDPEKITQLLYAAAELRSETYTEFLRAYGSYVVADILRIYKHLFRLDGADLFDLLQQVLVLYRRYRRPDVSNALWIDFDEVTSRRGVFHYRSAEGESPLLCHVVHGMLERVAELLDQRVIVRQSFCADAQVTGDDKEEYVFSNTTIPKPTSCQFDLRAISASSANWNLHGLDGDKSQD